MADKTSVGAELPLYDIKSPLDIKSINPQGIGEDPEITSAYRRAVEENKRLAQSVQERFSEVNFGKIAEAFGRPQLGGFAASMGSVGGVLGEMRERQKAIEPTIARMRAEIGAGEIVLAQRTKQKQLLDEWKKTGQPMDANTYQNILSYDPNSAIANSATKYYDAARAALGMKAEAAEQTRKNPLSDVTQWMNFSLNPQKDPDETQRILREKQEQLRKSRPSQIMPEVWNAMSDGDKLVTLANAAQTQVQAGMSEEEKLRQVADAAPSRLSLLARIRDTALGEGLKIDERGRTGRQQMAELFNFFGSNNPIDAVARAAADGNLLGGQLKGFDNYVKQMQMSPAARDNFQVLVKLLSENQTSFRSSSVNPTDAFQRLTEQSQPGVQNSQKALVTLVDMMANNDAYGLEKYRKAKEFRLPYGQLAIDPRFLESANQHINEQRRIVTSDPTLRLPAWYTLYTGRSNEPEQASAQPSAAPAPTPAASAAPTASAPPPAARPRPSPTTGTAGQPQGGQPTILQRLAAEAERRDAERKKRAAQASGTQ